MKIAWLVNNINQMGGIEKVVCGLSNHFSCELGHSIQIVSINSFETNTFFHLDSSVAVHHCKLDWREQTFWKLTGLVGAIMKTLNADILITCHPTISYAAILNKRKFCGKLVVTQHNTNDYFSKKRLLANVGMFRFSDRFVVLTNQDQQSYKKLNCKACVIPNANFDEVNTVSPLQEKIILAAGRVEYIKGFDMLLDAFAKIAPKHPDWKLCICGGGTIEDDIYAQAERLGIIDRVILPGRVKNMDEYYSRASVFALPSRNEGFPLVLIEAMSYGLPVISFELPSVQDIFADGGCLVVPQGDVHAFAENLDLLLKDTVLRTELAKKSKQLSETYTPAAIAERWMTLFHALINE